MGIAVLCAKLALVPIVFDPAALVVFAVPKALLSHALALVLAGVLGALVIQEGRQVLVWGRAQIAVLAIVLAYSAAAVFAENHVVAVFGAPDRLLGLASLLDGAILYLAGLVLVRTRGQLALMVVATVAGAAVVLAYALVQRLGLDPLPWASGFGPTRPFSTLGNPGVLAQYLGSLGAGLLALAAFAQGASRVERLALAGAGVCCTVGVLASATRASFIGFVVVALAFVGIALVRSNLHGRRAAVWGGIALLALATAAATLTPLGRLAQVAAFDALSEREALNTATFAADAAPPQQVENSLLARIVLYEIAAQQFLERPVLGVGPDNFVAAYPRFRPVGIATVLPTTAPETSAHSWVAKLLSDAGLAGALTFAAAIGLSVLAAVRSGFAGPSAAGFAMIAFYLGGGLVSVNDIGTEWIIWAGLGLLVSPVVAPPSPRARPRERDLLVWLVLGATLLAALGSGFALAGSRAASDSRSARARGEVPQAIAAAERSIGLDGLRAEHWQGLGLSYAAGGRLHDALRAFERAVELAPYHVTYLANVAKAHLVLASQNEPGAAGRAVAAAERAVATDPNNGEAHFALALVAQQTGQSTRAAEASERGLELMPRARDVGAYEIAGRAYIALQRYADAERWLRLGLPLARPSELVPLRLVLARVLIAQGRVADARIEIERVLAFDPMNATALRLRAEIESGR